MKETKHTALPWEKLKVPSGYGLYSRDTKDIVSHAVQSCDADFILQACNNHYELLDALRDVKLSLKIVLDYTKETLKGCDAIDSEIAIMRANRVIAKIEGEVKK